MTPEDNNVTLAFMRAASRCDEIATALHEKMGKLLTKEEAEYAVNVVLALTALEAEAMSQAKRKVIERAICCPQGCQYLGDSEDGNTCYCDTSDFRSSKIERATDAVLAALHSMVLRHDRDILALKGGA